MTTGQDFAGVSGLAIWGNGLSSCLKCLQRIGNALSLPSLAKLHEKKSSESSNRRVGGLSDIVAQGSYLPSANSHAKGVRYSCISGNRMTGQGNETKIV